MQHQNQCKILIVPEEGWFGQLKYSTHIKNRSTLCRLLLLFSKFNWPDRNTTNNNNNNNGTCIALISKIHGTSQ